MNLICKGYALSVLLLAIQVPAETRVIAGTEVSDEVPFMTRLDRLGSDSEYHFTCGASLISSQYVLTAAHCVTDSYGNLRDADDFLVDIGSLQPDSDESVETRNISQIIVHDQWDPDTYDYDYALLKLSSASTQTPVSLADVSEGDTVTAMGWGDMDPTTYTAYPDSLMQTGDLTVLSNEDCNAMYTTGDEDAVTDRMVCAQGEETLSYGEEVTGDTCQGDSGGPLLRSDSNGDYVQVGIVSWGAGCGEPEHPGVYARLSEADEWLDSYAGVQPVSSSADDDSGSSGSVGSGIAALLSLLLLAGRKRAA